MTKALVDTSPLVALGSEQDEHHETCKRELERFSGPLFTCWPVLTESCYLLRNQPASVRKLLKAVQEGKWICLAFLDEKFLGWVDGFFGRYSDREPQLADAALIYLAQRDSIFSVFTLDRRDFSVYRLDDGRALEVCPELP